MSRTRTKAVARVLKVKILKMTTAIIFPGQMKPPIRAEMMFVEAEMLQSAVIIPIGKKTIRVMDKLRITPHHGSPVS